MTLKLFVGRNVIPSVVAILTLEIVGIPQYTRDREIPWCSADFVPRPTTRSSAGTFEVSIFESSEPDFLLPIGLYQWRLQQLELKILEQGEAEGIEITDFYVGDGGEDGKFETSPCQIVSITENHEQEMHFQNSGYNALKIRYESLDEGDACPWDVSIRGKENDAPLPSSLSSEQKRVISSILDELEKDEYIYSVFSAPVDTRIFVDYLQMIEVPMDTSLIRRRLNKNYYTNVLSVIADMKLIRDNCLKYNKQDSEISKEGVKLYESFSRAIDDQLSVVGFETAERTARKSTRSHSRIGTHNSQEVIEGRRSTRLHRESIGNNDSDLMPVAGAGLTSRAMRMNRRAYLQAQDSWDGESNEGPADEFSSSEDEKPSTKKRRAASKAVDDSEEDEDANKGDEYYDEDEDEDDDDDDDNDNDFDHETESSPRKRRARCTRKLSESEDEDDDAEDGNGDDDDDDAEEESERNISTRINIRRNTRSQEARLLQDETQGDCLTRLRTQTDRAVSEKMKSPRSSRKRTVMSPTSQLETLPSPKSKKRTSYASRKQPTSPAPSPGRKSSRLRDQGKYCDFASTNSESEESNSNVNKMSSRSRVKSKSFETSPERQASRRRLAVQYHDLSNSDLDSDADGSEIVRKSTKKRSKIRNSNSPPSKKLRPVPKDQNLPQISRWPAHVVKPDQLKKVCTEIIQRVVSYS